MGFVQNDVLDWIEKEMSDPKSKADVIEKFPELTIADSYRLQFALMKRKAARGERLMGYKAAHTSLAIQTEQDAGISIGSLLQSFQYAEDVPFPITPGIDTCVEPEIAVLLERDLAGPGVTLIDACRATAAKGVVISVNGVPKRSATGVEAMGHPLNVVAAIANEIALHGESLKAGMVLLTGSLTNNVAVSPGDQIRVEFTRIGSVGARFIGAS
jgi:2-keto-4-pentenoate hydratase